MKKMKVKIILTEEMLGTASGNPELHDDFIAHNAPDAKSRAEEIEAVGVEEVIEKGRTVFPRGGDGRPIVWDYQIRGFFKDTCGMLRMVPKTKSSAVKAYKKKIDGLIFIAERRIPIDFDGEVGICQRPLRAMTMQGERVALASSETVPAGSTLTFTVQTLLDDDMDMVREWLDYGTLRGLGQWRNSGKGRFTWEEIK